MTLAKLRGLRHASRGPRKPMTRDTSSGVGGALTEPRGPAFAKARGPVRADRGAVSQGPVSRDNRSCPGN